MKPLRKHAALAIDGGGIRGVIVARALAMLETHLGRPAHSLFRLTSGTSTGSVLAAGIAAGLSGQQMFDLYCTFGEEIFQKSWRTRLFPLTRYKYPAEPLEEILSAYVGDIVMGDLWSTQPATDVVITTFDLKVNRTRFIKPWKAEYRDWPVVKAVMASCSAPTYFPVVEHRYIDGGVGSYGNPCYLAAYELLFHLGWDPAETTLISLGTGRADRQYDPIQTARMWPWQWLEATFDAFGQSANDQQVHLVDTFFQNLDFRRYQVDLAQPIAMDDISKIPRLIVYGGELGRMLLGDQLDRAQAIRPEFMATNLIS